MFKRGSGIKAVVSIAAIITIFAAHTMNSPATAPESVKRYENTEFVIKTAENVTKPAEIVTFSEETEPKPQQCVFLNIPLSEELQEYTFKCCHDPDLVGDNPISYTLILAIIDRETGGSYKFDLRSPTNDTGLMQINDCNITTLETELETTDLKDPYQNIKAGIYLLATYAKKYEPGEALMVYNMGEEGAKKAWDAGIYETDYSRAIIAREWEFSQYIDERNLTQK